MIDVDQSQILGKKIFAEVAALARDLESDELSVRISDAANLPVRIAIQHSATFSIRTAVGKGAIPNTARALNSRQELQAELDRRLEQVKQESGSLIDEWIAKEAGEYRRLLPEERCMRARPILGVQEVCMGCNGATRIMCPVCSGARLLRCSTCGGTGRHTCNSCGGSKATMCWTCSGAGSFEKRSFELTSGERQDTMNQREVIVRVPCTGCGGSGKVACSCSDGTVTCGGCGGRGQVNCSGCGAAGTIACPNCAATGVVHQIGWIQCTVDRAVRVDVTSSVPEDQETLRDHVPFDQITEMTSNMGGVRLTKSERADHRVTLQYSASLLVERAEATIHGQEIAIQAYGPQRSIYDYHDLVGKLLEPDLVHLEESLRGHSILGRNTGSGLPAAIRRFLASEVNALVAEAPPPVEESPAASGTGFGSSLQTWLKTTFRSPVRTIRNAMLLAPLYRFFRRRGIVLKIVMIIIAIQIFQDSAALIAEGNLPVFLIRYLMVVTILFFVEARFRANATEANESRASSKSSGHGGEAAKAIESHVSSGMVSSDYTRRAGAALGKALPRLYGPFVMPKALWLTGALVVLFVVARKTFLEWPWSEKVLSLVVLTGLSWLVVELYTASKLKALLAGNQYERQKHNFQRTRNRFRLLPIAALAIAWYATSFV